MLDTLPRPPGATATDSRLTAALARAAAAIARLDQALAFHPLRPAFLHRARLDAVRRQAAVDGRLIDPWHLAALLEGLRLRMDASLRIIDRGAIFEAARHALRPGGRLLLETPNPTNLTMGACNFYLDPTHRSPMPPALTAFLVEASGFTDVEIRPLHPDDSPLDPAAGTPTPVEALVERALRGPRDYAVLGVRP